MSHRSKRKFRSFSYIARCGVATLAFYPLLVSSADTGLAPLPKIAFPDAVTGSRQVPVENQPFTSNATVAAIPHDTVTPESLGGLPEVSLPQLPPVDPAVEAQARKEMAQETAMLTPVAPPAPVTEALPESSQIVAYPVPAPLPAMATPSAPPAAVAPLSPTTADVARPGIAELPKIVFPPLQPEPVAAQNSAVAAPVASTPAPVQTAAAMPAEPLSKESKKVLDKLPSKLDTTKKPAPKRMDIARMTPEIQSLIKKNAPKVDTYDSVGLSIKVQRPGLDTNYELNRAYTSLMGGDTAEAIEIYKNILSSEPQEEEALFGLAATYHRLGELEKARPYYAELLRVNPQHREGLNNFLALISDEAPEEALAELERLEQRNPEFSPIPAQQGVLLNKLGYFDQAREKMLRAIDLAPENMTYKFNLAVMMDQHKEYAHASALYRMLIDAALHGEKIPGSVEALQKRLNFISTMLASHTTAGG